MREPIQARNRDHCNNAAPGTRVERTYAVGYTHQT
jgi:hypothetical protein